MTESNGGKVAVVGFAKTGKALLEFLLTQKQVEHLYLYDDNPRIEAREIEEYKNRGVTFLVGAEDFNRLGEMDLIILSPGVNALTPRFTPLRQKGIRLISEIEFASQFIDVPLIAVTGTNGKSTTVSLIHHFLTSSGRNSVLAGNIGNPVISEVKRIAHDSIVVLEVSSFQLEEIFDFRPHIAVLLNVTPDHLDRYPAEDDYFAAKFNIFKNQTDSDYQILNHHDAPLLEHFTLPGMGRRIWFSIDEELAWAAQRAFIKDDAAVLQWAGKTDRISLRRNPLRGIHNAENVLAAVTAARLMGLETHEIEAALETFKGLPHRMESLGSIGKVEFINDSKATNVDAALKSLNSFSGDLIVILGGKDKGGDFSLLEEAVTERVNKVLLMGQAATAIYEQLSSVRDRCEFVPDLNEAAKRGYQLLQKGEKGGVVLLSPGCASFDMFHSFEHRGEVFREAFLSLKRQNLGAWSGVANG
jgi:UDP-N-acetylmuramoylalanine--D-glutamate ligase